MKQKELGLASGFTVIELITVIVVMGIIASLTWAVITGQLQYANDNERATDVATTARTFERYYRAQSSSSGVPTYPTVTQINTASQRALIIPDNDERIVAPYQKVTTNLSAATTTATPSPTSNQYIYQPLTATNTICTGSAQTPCVKFTIYYRKEQNDMLMSVESIHQQ